MCEYLQDSDPQKIAALPKGTVRVDVTSHDMAAGTRFQACDCPVAHALSRQFGISRINLTVSTTVVLARDNFGRVMRSWRLDETGREFRWLWDAGQRDQTPATFWMTPLPVTSGADIETGDLLQLSAFGAELAAAADMAEMAAGMATGMAVAA